MKITNYEIIIKKNMTCPKAGTMIELVEKLEPEKSVTVKSVIGSKKVTGAYPVYLEEEDPKNQYGLIQSIGKDKDTFDDADIEEVVKRNNYEIKIEKFEDNCFKGTFVLVQNENKVSEGKITDNIRDLVDKIVDSGLQTREVMDKRIAYMLENHIDELLIERTLKSYRNYNKPCHKPSCLFQDPYLEESIKQGKEGIIAEGLRAALSRQAIICEGEKSVGKNVYLETIAELLNKPMYLITFSRNMSPSSIYGEKTTDNSAAEELCKFDSSILAKADVVEEKRKFMMNFFFKQGKSACEAVQLVEQNLSEEEKEIMKEAAKFKMLQAQSSSVNIVIDQSELYDWLIDGGVLVFNEMNLAEANFFASFTNQLLDGTGFLFIPGRGEVKIHPDCVLFGTQNADYCGVEQQNEATLSRFGCIVFPQPMEIKKQLIAATNSAIKKGYMPEATLDKKYFNECQNFYKQCRDAVNKGVVTNACLNIRGFVRALTAVAESGGYAKLKRQIEIHVINTCPTDDRMALMATLEQIVTL